MESFSRRRSVLLFAVLGVIFSAILLFHHVEVNSGYQSEPSLCAINETVDCDAVAKSKFSTVLGIPVASYSLFFFVALYTFVVVARPATGLAARTYHSVIAAAAIVALLPTLVMLGITVFAIGKLCLYCLVLYCNNIAFAFVALTQRDSDETLGSLINNGFREIFGFFLLPLRGMAATSPLAPVATVSLAGLIFAGLFIYVIPNFIFVEIIVPRVREAQRNATVESDVLKQFSKAVAVDIPVNDLLGPDERDYTIGPEGAKITIVEFSDFECPFCKRAASMLKELVEEFEPNVRVVFKNFPLDSACNASIEREFHRYACRSAKMARCAGAQGREYFWEMHDAIFGLGSIDDESLAELPKTMGLSEEEFSACMESSIVDARIREDVTLGRELQLRGTPSIYINGKKFPGRLNQETLRKVVQSELKSHAS